MKIFKFKTEKQLIYFDNKYNYSGCMGKTWMYGEGTDRWFSLQHCGDRWLMNVHIEGTHSFDHKTFYPTTYKEFTDFIEKELYK